MSKFDIKEFLTEKQQTEVSKVNNLGKRLKEVKGSETKEGQEILDYFAKNLGFSDAGRKYMEKSLNSANPHSLKEVYDTIQRWKDDNYQVTPQDAAIINDRLRR